MGRAFYIFMSEMRLACIAEARNKCENVCQRGSSRSQQQPQAAV